LLQSLSSNENHDPKKLELYLYILISNLPYVADNLRKDDPDFLIDLIGLIQDYFKTPNKRLNLTLIHLTKKKVNNILIQDLKSIWEVVSESLRSSTVKSEILIKVFPEHQIIFSSRSEDSLYFPKIKFNINLDVLLL
jgi:hypothetical protein